MILPKTETAAQVEVLLRCGRSSWPLIESTKGLLALESIARAKGVERLSFGGLDLALDLGLKGVEGSATIINHARYQLLRHSVGVGLVQPIDTIFANISNLDGLSMTAHHSPGIGFEGMLCIRPARVPVIDRVFAPNAHGVGS